MELSKAQDIEAGDGTTTVVVLAGSLLDASAKLLNKGLHPTVISEAFQVAAAKACEVIKAMSRPIDLADKDLLLKIASTSLNSKVVSQYSGILSPIAVDSVLAAMDPNDPEAISLNDIRIVKKLGQVIVALCL